MADIIGSGNKKDKWTKKVTEWINWLNEKKQAKLVEGDNVTLTPLQDGTVEISAAGGSMALDDLTDVDVSSVTDGQALVYDETNEQWVAGEAGQVDDVKVNGTSVVSNKIAEITSYKEVTQAEYDALTEAQKMNGVAYFIKDALLPSRSNIYAPVIYSTNERCIGVWTDGRPLYQVTKIFNNIASGRVDNMPHGIANTHTLLLVDWKFTTSSNSYGIIGYDSLDASKNYWCSIISYNSVGITYRIGESWNATRLVCTFLYTKTTDVAGSGNWGTDGIPTHHYSTSEKVIGTWLDGKTLYEKTIDCGALPNQATKTIAHNVNFDFIVNAFGTAQDTTTKQVFPIPFTNSAQRGGTYDTTDSQIMLFITTTDITLRTWVNRSNFNKTYVTIQYTKAT